jgi:hypothetical protein
MFWLCFTIGVLGVTDWAKGYPSTKVSGSSSMSCHSGCQWQSRWHRAVAVPISGDPSPQRAPTASEPPGGDSDSESLLVIFQVPSRLLLSPALFRPAIFSPSVDSVPPLSSLCLLCTLPPVMTSCRLVVRSLFASNG